MKIRIPFNTETDLLREQDVAKLELMLSEGEFGHDYDSDGLDPRDGGEYAFRDMLSRLQDGTYRKLTDKQRGWVDRTLRHMGLSLESPAERNASVPIGRPVLLAPVLRVLPLKPPSKRSVT